MKRDTQVPVWDQEAYYARNREPQAHDEPPVYPSFKPPMQLESSFTQFMGDLHAQATQCRPTVDNTSRFVVKLQYRLDIRIAPVIWCQGAINHYRELGWYVYCDPVLPDYRLMDTNPFYSGHLVLKHTVQSFKICNDPVAGDMFNITP